MRIPSGKIDQSIYFVAVDATDLNTRETGLSSFTVYRSRNGAAEVAYTTPTIVEIDATNMPGVYALLIDEDTSIASTSDSEEYALHITHAGMAPVTRTIELYRRTVTAGNTLLVAASGALGTAAIEAASFAANAIAAAAIAANALTSAKFAAGAFDAVWSVAARVLTAGTNIVLAKGAGVTGFNDLDAAGVRTAVGLSTANLDAQLAAVPTGNENADALLDQTAGVETGLTVRQAFRLAASVLFGKASGLGTSTAVYRDVADTKDRISATVDASGNRTAVTRDAT